MPEFDIAPGDAKVAGARVGSVGANLVVKGVPSRGIIISERLLAIDVDTETLGFDVVNRVNINSGARLSDTTGDSLAALDRVQVTALLYAHDEVRTNSAMEGLSNADAVTRHAVDLELAGKLVHARRVVGRVALLGTEMAIAAAAAFMAAIGRLGDVESKSIDATTSARLVGGAGMVLDPVAALEGRVGQDGRRSGQSSQDVFGEHFYV